MLELVSTLIILGIVVWVVRTRRRKSSSQSSSTDNTTNSSKSKRKWGEVLPSWEKGISLLLPIVGLVALCLVVASLAPEIWDRFWKNQGFFWAIMFGLLTAWLLFSSYGNKESRWIGTAILLMIALAFGREMWEEFAPVPTSKREVVWRQLCSAEGQVTFTKPFSDLNREDPEMVGLPATTPERCLKLEVRQEEFGRPFVFTYKVSRKGFDATGTITLTPIRVEGDGWERVGYSETFTNPLDGKRTHQVEGLLWCKNGYCHGVAKDAGGKPLANRLLLGKVFSK